MSTLGSCFSRPLPWRWTSLTEQRLPCWSATGIPLPWATLGGHIALLPPVSFPCYARSPCCSQLYLSHRLFLTVSFKLDMILLHAFISSKEEVPLPSSKWETTCGTYSYQWTFQKYNDYYYIFFLVLMLRAVHLRSSRKYQSSVLNKQVNSQTDKQTKTRFWELVDMNQGQV